MQSGQVREAVKFSPLNFNWIGFCQKNLSLNRYLWLFLFWHLSVPPKITGLSLSGTTYIGHIHKELRVNGLTQFMQGVVIWRFAAYWRNGKCYFAWLSRLSRFRWKICDHYHLLPIHPCTKVLRADIRVLCFSANIRKVLLVFLPVKAYAAALHANSNYWQDKGL